MKAPYHHPKSNVPRREILLKRTRRSSMFEGADSLCAGVEFAMRIVGDMLRVFPDFRPRDGERQNDLAV